MSCSPKQDIVRSIAGPMTTSLATIETYMKALIDSEPWNVDVQLAPIPWRSNLCTKTKPLKIGYIIDDGIVKVQPPVARAMREVISALKKAGHEGKE